MRATSRANASHAGPSGVAVLVPGASALAVLDGRAPGFSPEQVEEALKVAAERSGPVVALVRARSEESWAKVRSELNQVAKGQASARTMIHAHHALRAHQALELQHLSAGVAYGTGDDLAEKHMRNAAGLAVVASDALNKAYESAKEDAAARAGETPTQQLLTRIGASPGSSPALAPRGESVGAPSSPNPASPEKDAP